MDVIIINSDSELRDHNKFEMPHKYLLAKQESQIYNRILTHTWRPDQKKR